MRRSDWIHIWQLFKDVFKYERKAVICTIIAAVLGAVKPYIFVVLLGQVLDMVYAGADLQMVVKYLFFVITAKLILDIILAYTEEYFWQKLENPKEFGTMPFNRKALTMDYEYLEETHVQELRFSAFNKSFFGVAGWLLYQLFNLMGTVVSLSISVIIIFPIFINNNATEKGFIGSGIFTLILIGVLLITTYVNYRRGISCTRKSKEIADSYNRQYNKKRYYMDMMVRVEAQKDIRISNYEIPLKKDVDVLFAELKECERRQGREFVKWKVVEQLVGKISILLIYIFTGLRAYVGMITIGNVVTYAASMVQFTNDISRFANTIGHLKSVAQYAEEYYEFISLEKRKYDGTIPLEKRRDNRFQVDFEHVSFKYPGSDEYVIKDLNVSFVIGEKMAIVGTNGSGKTTFIKLLCRLYDVTEGCIKVNGIDIRKYDYKEYCNLFAVVFQDFQIFSFALGENIAASDHVEEERVMDALARAGLEERVKNLPEGLETYVGKEFHESGVVFSGGEKQKMAIARAIYKNAPFVIMDEPTAALDPESECEVYAGFDKMVGNKTALYISHRLASCRFCEDILVFDKGQVVQRGSHEELEQQEGLYRELWNAQAQYYA